MTYVDHRLQELKEGLLKYHEEMAEIHVKRLDIDRQEIEAWRELQQVLLADFPDKLSQYFNK